MRRTPLVRLGLATIIAALPIAPALAQTPGDVVFELRPHCIDGDHAAAEEVFGGTVPDIDGITKPAANPSPVCPSFGVRDPLSKQTDILKVGDTLDMDLVMHNPKGADITRYRVWIAYDSNVLQGTAITLSDAFSIPTPGEADFSTADNYIKAAASSEQPVKATKVVLARIVLTVKSAPANGVILAFHDPSGQAAAHTAAFTGKGDTEANIAAKVQGSLAVRFAAGSSPATTVTPTTSTGASNTSSTPPAATTSSSSPTTTTTTSIASSKASTTSVSSKSSSSAVPLVFSKLQVQALRVTTEGSSAFLAWNPLPSAEIAGYNLYYGSISGRYLQRRSVTKESQTLTIRALPVGMTYYFAVRAVNAAGIESDFSQEVGVTIGNPATSTSPLSGNLIEGPQGNAPYTDGTVAGDSGPESWVASLIGLSAILGTAFAFRRQWTARSVLPQ